MHGANHSSNNTSGVKALDASHEYMSFTLERFFHPQVICADPGGICSRLEDTLHFLKKHLGHEERLMIETGYLGYGFTTHKRKHKELLRNLDRLKRTLICGDYDNNLMTDYLTEWVKNHATDLDKPFGEFLRKKGIELFPRKGF